MSTIFGSNGDRYNRQGSTNFYSGQNGEEDRIFHQGSTSFSGNGNMFSSVNTSFFGNQRIMKSGDTYFCGNKSYKLMGNTLYGSDGQRWYGAGGMSDGDIRDIISHDN